MCYNLLSTDLCAEEFGGGVGVGVVGGDVNEAVDIVLCDCFGDAGGAFHVHVLEIKVPDHQGQ